MSLTDLAVPADRRLRVPVGLPHRGAGRAGRLGRLAVRARLRLAQRVREPPRPRRRLVPVRPVRHQRAHRAHLRARHQRADHHLAHPRRLAPRPRRPDDGATTGAGHGHPAHQAARRRRRRAPARAHRGVPRGIGRGRAGLRAGVRLRPGTGRVDAGRRRGPRRRRRRRRADPPAEHRPVDRHRGQLRPRPARAGEGRAGVLRAVVGRRSRLPHRRRRRRRAHRGDRPVLAQLAGPSAHPRPPAAAPARAVGAHDQGPDLHAHRRHRRRADHLAARDARRRAQLGLPLHVDARHAPSPCRRCTTCTSTGRPTSSCSSSPTSSRTQDGGLQIMYGIDGRRDLTESTRDELSGYEGARPGADRERRVRPAPERRVRRGPRLAPAAHPPQQAPAATAVAARAVAGGGRHRRLARARPGHLGGPREAPALRVLEADGLGRAGPGRQAGRDPRRPQARSRRGPRPPRRSGPTSSPTASATAASCASTTTPTRSTPRRCSPRSSASCPAPTSGCATPSTPSPRS